MPARTSVQLDAAVVTVYNETKDLPDKRRPGRLQSLLRVCLGAIAKRERSEARAYVERLLGGVFLHVETMPGQASRFVPPDLARMKHPGQGLLNIHARLPQDCRAADLWVQSSHLPVDGGPIQEMLTDLRAAWGTRGELVFPSPGTVAAPLR